MRRGFLVALCASVVVAPAVAADASKDPARDYPNHPIRLLVPNAPGSSVDTLGRIFAQGLTNVSGQQVVIDNRAGAGGVLGMEIGKERQPRRLYRDLGVHRRDDDRSAYPEQAAVRPPQGLRIRLTVRHYSECARRDAVVTR